MEERRKSFIIGLLTGISLMLVCAGCIYLVLFTDKQPSAPQQEEYNGSEFIYVDKGTESL